MTDFRRISLAATALGAGVLVLTACGSSSGSGMPSQSQVVAKLKTDSTLSTAFDQLPSSEATIKNDAYGCIAQAMRKDFSASDVHAYVDGSKSIKQVGGTSSDSKATSDVKTCLENAVKSGTGSGSQSASASASTTG